MPMAAVLLLMGLGLVLTVKGGDLFVDAAVWLAEAWGVPKFLVGATVVSLATTLPEVAVSLLATAAGAGGIAAGNAVGSVAANLGLILGLGLCLSGGMAARPRDAARLFVMALAAEGLCLACGGGRLSPAGALALPLLCAAFLAEGVLSGRARPGEARPPRPGLPARFSRVGRFLAGALGIAVGARLLSGCGAALARLCGVPEGVIGATLVAVGTSLPELVTALAALSRGEPGLSVGNVVGANVIDLTLILPLCAGLQGGSLPLPRQTLALDLPFCLILSLLAALPPLLRGRLSRLQGAALLAVYGLYLARIINR